MLKGVSTLTLKVQEFLRQVPELGRIQVPKPWRDFATLGTSGSLVKLHYGYPWVHYEVWVQRRRAQVEVGLHFEADTETNAHYLEYLSGRFEEVRAALGPPVEPEQWTESWTRVHQDIPFETLEEEFLIETTLRVAQMIAVLEPMVREERERWPFRDSPRTLPVQRMGRRKVRPEHSHARGPRFLA